MLFPIHNIKIKTEYEEVTLPLRCRIVYPFAIHRRVKSKNDTWITDNAPNTKGYVLTHLLTGASVCHVIPKRHGHGMVEARNRLISLAESLADFPEFLMFDVNQVTSGPNRKEIAKMITDAL